MTKANFTADMLNEMVERSIEKYRIKEGYGEHDKKWVDLKRQLGQKIKDAFNGDDENIEPHSTDKRLSDYVRNNFGKDKGSGLKKFGRQANRAAQVGIAGAGIALTPAARIAGKATRAAKAIPGKTRYIANKIIGEGEEALNFEVPQDYTHFAVRKSDNKIVNGWNYEGHEQSELKQFARDYFMVDLEDMGVNPKLFKIVTANGCKSHLGIDPFDPANWSNFVESDLV